MPARRAGKKKDAGAQEGILQGAAALIAPALDRPEELITKPAAVIKALRGTCSSLYTAARITHKGGLGRIYTGEGYDPDQIYSQLEGFTDSVTGGFDAALAAVEQEAAAAPAEPATHASHPPASAEAGGDDDDDDEAQFQEFAELMAMEEAEEDEEEEDLDGLSGEEAEEGVEDDEEMEEDEEEEEEEADDEVDELAAVRGKSTKIGAARKKIDRQEEEALLREIEGAYKKKKKKREDGTKDEEEDLLDKLEAMHGESDTDESFEPAIGTTSATRKEKKEKAEEKKKAAKQKPGKQEKKEAAAEKPFDPYAGYGSDEGEEGEEEDEVDEEMLAEQAEDEKAMREMYGIGNFDPSQKFGELDEEEGAGMDAEQVDREKEKMKRSGKRGKAAAAKAAEEEEEGYSSDEEEVLLDDEMDDEELAPDTENGLTPFQQRQAKLQKKIARIEDDRLKETHWTLQGETMASARPENALLEEVLEFDHTQKAKPLITAELTKSLEERLTRRIQESLFDDVVRKQRKSSALDLTIAHKNEIDLHAKSKVGLADLYEKEWLDNHRKTLEEQGETTKELTEEEKEELKVIQMWRSLASSLDMLSNFYYTPKPAAADELAVRAATRSAISMEEATPAAVSNEKLLAPQDIAAPNRKRKFDDAGADELTTKDKKRLRRTIKENNKAKEKRKATQKTQKEEKKARFSKASSKED